MLFGRQKLRNNFHFFRAENRGPAIAIPIPKKLSLGLSIMVKMRTHALIRRKMICGNGFTT
jgi:hypothetical protein